MTNDELNFWLNLWYHVEVLGKCVHEWERWNDGGGAWWQCKNCPALVDGTFNPSTVHLLPDYLSDPAVFRDIIKKLLDCGLVIWSLYESYAIKEYQSHMTSTSTSQWYSTIASDKSLERAMMLALKAKVENE